MWTLHDAEAVLALGADAAAVGRAAVANPDWAYRGRRPELGASPPTVTIEALPAG